MPTLREAEVEGSRSGCAWETTVKRVGTGTDLSDTQHRLKELANADPFSAIKKIYVIKNRTFVSKITRNNKYVK